MDTEQLDVLLRRCVDRAAQGVEFLPTGVEAEAYLETAEPIVRSGAQWQDECGRVVDPWQGVEVTWASARFVGALGGLVGAGRCLDLLPHLEAGIRYIADRYVRQARGEVERIALEFFSKEFGWALLQARKHLSPETWTIAAEAVAQTDPDLLYVDTLAHHKPEEIFNFNTFSLAGEQLLRRIGMRVGGDYIERHLPHHLPRFTPLGLYCDPDAAMVYDWVPRVNLSTMLWAGYGGPLAKDISERLAQGARTQLLLQGPSGLAWFGGRSNQYQFNEMQLAVIYEYEAARLAESDPVLAGMYRRAARLALRAVRPWLELDPPRHIKNAFHPAVAWGFDHYGGYSVYLLLAASLMTFAYHFARTGGQRVEEAPLPSELGAYGVNTGPGFHRIFFHCRGVEAEIDAAADPHYDATGLGRVVWANAPWHLQLPAPMASDPKYLLPRWLQPGKREVAWGEQGCRAAAVACAWKNSAGGDWTRLAEATGPWQASWESAGDDGPLFATVTWDLKGQSVTLNLTISDSSLRLCWEVPGAAAVRCEWPVMLTDGSSLQPQLQMDSSAAIVRAGDTALIISADGAAAELLDGVFANRNGLWRVVVFEKQGERLQVTAKLTRPV
ncbi:MAG: hypothetical protein H5T86_12680 [Armatimonadetes bacterium]|nr:hypothetical protein [Armatimonadota bacterium]